MKLRKGFLWTAAGAGVYAAAAAALRPLYLNWGTTEQERADLLPGDQLMDFASSTRAVTIDAPVHEVWQWLVQIGQDRAGFYSYDWLERLVLAGIHNVDRVVPEWQKLEKGNVIRLAAQKVYGDRPLLRVAEIEEGRYFVLEGWGAFILRPLGANTTRLIIRSHGRNKPGWQRAIDMLFFEPAHFIMERKMLLGIKARAEAGAKASAAA